MERPKAHAVESRREGTRMKSMDIHKQTVECPVCGSRARMRQIEDWGMCEACHAQDKEETSNELDRTDT